MNIVRALVNNVEQPLTFKSHQRTNDKGLTYLEYDGFEWDAGHNIHIFITVERPCRVDIAVFGKALLK